MTAKLYRFMALAAAADADLVAVLLTVAMTVCSR
jgi:hypothetical protein